MLRERLDLICKSPRVPLFSETPEHAHAVLCEKALYTLSTPGQQCSRLTAAYNKAFDAYITADFEQQADERWMALVPRLDVWKAMNLGTPSLKATNVALVAEDTRGGQAVTLCEQAGAELPLPLDGIPTIALPHTQLKIVVTSPTSPGTALLRYRYLPTDVRDYAAFTTHARRFGATGLEWSMGPNGVHLVPNDECMARDGCSRHGCTIC